MRYNDQIQTALTPPEEGDRRRFDDADTGLLFEGRVFAQDGGQLDLSKMAKALCPPFLKLEEFRAQLANRIAENQSGGGLLVFETGSRGGHCQIRILVRGEKVRAVCLLLRDPSSRQSASVPTELETLTAREKQVLSHLVHGVTTKQVAAALFLSPRTIEKHRARIYQKTGTHSLALLTRMWLQAESALCDSQ